MKKLTILFVSVVIFIAASICSYAWYKSKTVAAYNGKPVEQVEPKDIQLFNKDTNSFESFNLKPKGEGSNKYTISIIIPVHNVEKYLEECIDSVLQQITPELYEIILIENNSSDSSLEVAMKYSKAHKSITLIRQDGGGAGGARNTGILAAQGEYIMFLDSDDWLEPNAIADATDSISDGADIVCFNFNIVDDVTHKILEVHRRNMEYDKIMHTSQFGKFELNNRVFNAVWARLYKREMVLSSQTLFSNTSHYEDFYFDMVMFLQPITIQFYNAVIMNYRVNRSGSLTNNGPNIYYQFLAFDNVIQYLKDTGMFNEYKNALLDTEIQIAVIGNLNKLNTNEVFELLKYLQLRYSVLDYLPTDSRYSKYFKLIVQGKIVKLWITKILLKRVGYVSEY